MKTRDFVVASLFEPAMREGSYICKNPSDQGPWVFVQLPEYPSGWRHYVIEITSTSRNGKSRQGKVLWRTEDVLPELMEALKSAVWLRERNGDPWVRGLRTSAGVFDSYYVPEFVGTRDHSARVVFEPAESSPFRGLRHELSNFLESEDAGECDRAGNAPFAAGIVPDQGKGEMIARLLQRKGLPVHADAE